jgi:hypothetical protein
MQQRFYKYTIDNTQNPSVKIHTTCTCTSTSESLGLTKAFIPVRTTVHFVNSTVRYEVSTPITHKQTNKYPDFERPVKCKVRNIQVSATILFAAYISVRIRSKGEGHYRQCLSPPENQTEFKIPCPNQSLPFLCLGNLGPRIR